MIKMHKIHQDSKAKFLLKLIDQFLYNKSVLVIDDEEAVQEMMSDYLIELHIEENRIVFASDGKEAISKILNQEFGLIIVDIRMPKLNGMELIKKLKLRAKYKDIPIIIISGLMETENVNIARSLGINSIIVKPFSYKVFVEKVGQALSVQMFS